jgi:hypothetical protein
MSETKPLEKEDDLKVFAIMTALVGVIALALWGLYYLVFSVLLSKPLVYIFSTIGNILEKTLGNIPSIGLAAIIFFIMAGILGVGSLLEDNDIDTYKILIMLFWSAAFAAFIGLWGYSAFNPIPVSVIIGISFILFIAPPFVFGILKGLCYLLELIIADACHNPFK